MKSVKALLLLTMALLSLSACGGAVEGGGTDVSTTEFNFVKGDPEGQVDKACSITAEFDGPIEASTISDQTFIVQGVTASAPLTATNGTWGVSPSSDTIALFTPSIYLVGSYSVRLTTAITSTSGMHLAENKFWTFNATLPCTP